MTNDLKAAYRAGYVDGCHDSDQPAHEQSIAIGSQAYIDLLPRAEAAAPMTDDQRVERAREVLADQMEPLGRLAGSWTRDEQDDRFLAMLPAAMLAFADAEIAEARRQAFEEAARVAEERTTGCAETCRAIATAIRNLGDEQ